MGEIAIDVDADMIVIGIIVLIVLPGIDDDTNRGAPPWVPTLVEMGCSTKAMPSAPSPSLQPRLTSNLNSKEELSRILFIFQTDPDWLFSACVSV
jgi:hypothetical protein